MTHTTLPYTTTQLPPGIFGLPDDKQRGRDWSSVWKPLSPFPAESGRCFWKNLARTTKLCLHPPGSSAFSPGQTVTHTAGKSKLQLWPATPRSPLSCNPSQDVTGITAIPTNNWAVKTQENHFLSLCLPRTHGGATKAQWCEFTGTSEKS